MAEMRSIIHHPMLYDTVVLILREYYEDSIPRNGYRHITIETAQETKKTFSKQ